MKKKYRAVGAMSLVLVTAFISVYGVGIINSKATTLGYPAGANTLNTYETTPSVYGTTQATITTQYENRNTIETKNPNNPGRGTYGDWVVIKEPTYEEDGLMMREYAVGDGTYNIEYEKIPKLKRKSPEIDPVEESHTNPKTSAPDNRDRVATESNAAKPEVKKPEVTEPKIKEPEAKNPETKNPEVKNPEVKKPETTKPEAKSPEVGKPDIIENEDTKAETKKEETKKANVHRHYAISNTVTKLGNENSSLEQESSSESVSDTAGSSESTEVKSDTVQSKNVGKVRVKAKASKRIDLPIKSASNNNNTNTDNSESSTLEITEVEISDTIKSENEKYKENIEVVTVESDNIYTSVDEPIPESKTYNNSFNRYDGATLLAAGVYAWWAVIVLLPMVNASKWINKKRKEKLRGNVNKKYN